MANELEKEAAARRSLDFVRPGYCVGLGSGTTATHAIRLLAERVKEGLDIRCVPTSAASGELAARLGILLASFDRCPQMDVTIDGADEISPSLDLIKGGGGALLREKIVASASRMLVIVADSSKQVASLGKFPLPVEVVPFAHALIAGRIAALGASVSLRQDEEGLPFVTDEGHYILDCAFGLIDDPARLAAELRSMPGVVEHGLFLDMADIVLIGTGSEVVELRSTRRNPPAESGSVCA